MSIAPIGRFRGARVAVIAGGLSAEREVSLVTGEAIRAALDERGYDTVWIDAGRDLPAALREHRVEVVYNALHGTYGEDGRVQGLLDWMGIPYTGEGLEASLLSFDKALAKERFRAAGVPVAEDIVWDDPIGEGLGLADLPFPLPVAVKPVADGSSVGVSMVHSADAFAPALAAAGSTVLIERFVRGVEISVGVLGDTVMGSVEIEPAREFYDYEAKYGSSGTRYHLPPRLDAEVLAAGEAAVLAAHRALGCRGATRSECIIGPDGPVVIEVNTLPGMTPTSLLPKIAGRAGLDFGSLCERILDAAAWGPDRQPAGERAHG